jgi:hypothetical protein
MENRNVEVYSPEEHFNALQGFFLRRQDWLLNSLRPGNGLNIAFGAMIEDWTAPIFKVGHGRALESCYIDLAVQNVDNGALNRTAVGSIAERVGRHVIVLLVEGLEVLRTICSCCREVLIRIARGEFSVL